VVIGGRLRRRRIPSMASPGDGWERLRNCWRPRGGIRSGSTRLAGAEVIPSYVRSEPCRA